MEKKAISVVMPAYNEEQNVLCAAETVASYLEAREIPYEIIFINDGSTDETFSAIEKAKEINPNVKGASFSRNFGKEAAIFAGLELATKDAVVIMDCDLQHPVDKLEEMYNLWLSGAEVVEGIKNSRGKEGIFHKAFAGLFYKIMSKLMKMDMNSTSDFKLLDRKVVQLLLALPERNTFFRALTFWTGFKRVTVCYDVQERKYGKSKWSFMSLIGYAISNATSFSTFPLQLVSYMGMLLILFSVILAVQTLVRFFLGTAVEGFTTVILLLLIVGGCIMLSLGIIGHYLARIYEEVKGRPKYIISKVTDNVPENIVGYWK